jgi:hypothetical protein
MTFLPFARPPFLSLFKPFFAVKNSTSRKIPAAVQTHLACVTDKKMRDRILKNECEP